MDNILSEKIKLNNVLHSFTLFTLSFCNCQELEITFGVFRRVINTDRQELKVAQDNNVWWSKGSQYALVTIACDWNCTLGIKYAPITQLAEYLPCKEDVCGSNPYWGLKIVDVTNFKQLFKC